MYNTSYRTFPIKDTKVLKLKKFSTLNQCSTSALVQLKQKVKKHCFFTDCAKFNKILEKDKTEAV
jgi:hypothetical protein